VAAPRARSESDGHALDNSSAAAEEPVSAARSVLVPVSAAVPSHAEQEDDEHQHGPPGDAQGAVVPAEDVPHDGESSTRVRPTQANLSTTSAMASATTEALRARSAASGAASSVRSSISSMLPSL